jgi:hypothetical protein
MLKKEAEYFGDIVILPFIDRYELVVLKTIAICEYGVRPSLLCYHHLSLDFCCSYGIEIDLQCQLEVVSQPALNKWQWPYCLP